MKSLFKEYIAKILSLILPYSLITSVSITVNSISLGGIWSRLSGNTDATIQMAIRATLGLTSS